MRYPLSIFVITDKPVVTLSVGIEMSKIVVIQLYQFYITLTNHVNCNLVVSKIY